MLSYYLWPDAKPFSEHGPPIPDVISSAWVLSQFVWTQGDGSKATGGGRGGGVAAFARLSKFELFKIFLYSIVWLVGVFASPLSLNLVRQTPTRPTRFLRGSRSLRFLCNSSSATSKTSPRRGSRPTFSFSESSPPRSSRRSRTKALSTASRNSVSASESFWPTRCFERRLGRGKREKRCRPIGRRKMVLRRATRRRSAKDRMRWGGSTVSLAFASGFRADSDGAFGILVDLVGTDIDVITSSLVIFLLPRFMRRSAHHNFCCQFAGKLPSAPRSPHKARPQPRWTLCPFRMECIRCPPDNSRLCAFVGIRLEALWRGPGRDHE